MASFSHCYVQEQVLLPAFLVQLDAVHAVIAALLLGTLKLRLIGSGAYLCVKGYGRTAFTYSLRAVYSQCPSDFTHDGKQMMCSSVVDAPESEKRYTGCSPDGVCECKAPYQKPLPEVYDGVCLDHSSTALCM